MVSSFPQMPTLINTSFSLFNETSKIFLQIAPLVFLARILLIKIMFKGKMSYGILLQDLLFMFVGFFAFEQVVRFVLMLPGFANDLMNSAEPLDLKTFKDSTFLRFLSMSGSEFMEFMSAIFYWVMNFLYILFIALFISVGSYIIFFSTMLRARWMLSVFFILLVLVSSWPFFWYAIDRTMSFLLIEIDKLGSEWGLLVTGIAAGLCKLLIPLASFFYALKDPVQIASGFKNSIYQGASPIKKGAAFTKNTMKSSSIGMAKATGTDQVLKAHLQPRLEKVKALSEAPRRMLQNSAPLAVYGVKKAAHSMRPKATPANWEGKTEKFPTFSQYRQDLHVKVTQINQKLSQANTLKLSPSYQSSYKAPIEMSATRQIEMVNLPGEKRSTSDLKQTQKMVKGLSPKSSSSKRGAKKEGFVTNKHLYSNDKGGDQL